MQVSLGKENAPLFQRWKKLPPRISREPYRKAKGEGPLLVFPRPHYTLTNAPTAPRISACVRKRRISKKRDDPAGQSRACGDDARAREKKRSAAIPGKNARIARFGICSSVRSPWTLLKSQAGPISERVFDLFQFVFASFGGSFSCVYFKVAMWFVEQLAFFCCCLWSGSFGESLLFKCRLLINSK